MAAQSCLPGITTFIPPESSPFEDCLTRDDDVLTDWLDLTNWAEATGARGRDAQISCGSNIAHEPFQLLAQTQAFA
jgi:hypothetical protein